MIKINRINRIRPIMLIACASPAVASAFAATSCPAVLAKESRPAALTARGTKGAPVKEEIAAILQAQANSWNQGDLDSFLKGYLKSNDISYVSGQSQVYGYDALRKRYESKYGNSKDTMGKLTFSDLKISALGKSHALCIGNWHLERKEKPPIDGIFTLLLLRTNDGWRIIHDHTSVRS